MKTNLTRRDALAFASVGLGVGSIGIPKRKSKNKSTNKILSSGFNAFDWTASEGRNITTKPVVGEERLFSVDDNSNILEFSIDDGESEQIGSVGGETPKGIAKQGDTLIVATRSGPMTSYDLQSKSVQWENTSVRARSEPEFTDEVIVVPQVGFALLAVDSQTGEIRWEYEAFSEFTAPTVIGDQAIALQDDGRVVSIGLSTGEELWSAQLPDSPVSNIIRTPSGVMAASNSGKIIKLRIENGNIINEYNSYFGSSKQITKMRRVTESDLILLTGDDEIVRFNISDREQEWIKPLERKVQSLLVKSGNKIIIQLQDGTILSLDPSDGDVTSQVLMKNQSNFRPVIDKSSIFFGRRKSLSKIYQRPNMPRLWSRSFDEEVLGLATPTDETGKVVVTKGSSIEEISILDGVQDWETSFSSSLITNSATLNNRVIIFREGGYIEAIRRGTGDEIWSKQPNVTPSNPPNVVQGSVFIPTEVGGIESWDAETGTRRWGVLIGSGAVTTKPVVGDEYVYAGDRAGIFSVDISNTQDIVKKETDGRVTAIAKTGMSLYYGTDTGVVGKYSLRNGEPGSEEWNQTLGSAVSSELTVDGQQLYLGSRDGSVFSMDINTGNISWKYRTGSVISSDLNTVNGKILAPSEDGQLYVLDKVSGAPLAGSNFSEPVDLSTVVGPDSIITGSSLGSVRSLSRSFKTRTETPTSTPTGTPSPTPTQTQITSQPETQTDTATETPSPIPTSTPSESPTPSTSSSPSASASSTDTISPSTPTEDSTVTVVPGMGFVAGTIGALLASKKLGNAKSENTDGNDAE